MRAKADALRAASPDPKYPHRWRPWIAAAAALLAVSFLVGVLATGGGLSLSGSSASSAAGSFQGVGSASSEPGIARPNPSHQLVAPTRNDSSFGYNQQAVLGAAPADAPGLSATSGAGGTTTSTGSANQRSQTTAAAPQTDLSKIIRDGQIAVTIDAGTFK